MQTTITAPAPATPSAEEQALFLRLITVREELEELYRELRAGSGNATLDRAAGDVCDAGDQLDRALDAMSDDVGNGYPPIYAFRRRDAVAAELRRWTIELPQGARHFASAGMPEEAIAAADVLVVVAYLDDQGKRESSESFAAVLELARPWHAQRLAEDAAEQVAFAAGAA